MKQKWIPAVALCLSGASAFGQVTAETPGWFPFVMSPTADGAGGPADVSFLCDGPAEDRSEAQ